MYFCTHLFLLLNIKNRRKNCAALFYDVFGLGYSEWRAARQFSTCLKSECILWLYGSVLLPEIIRPWIFSAVMRDSADCNAGQTATIFRMYEEYFMERNTAKCSLEQLMLENEVNFDIDFSESYQEKF